MVLSAVSRFPHLAYVGGGGGFHSAHGQEQGLIHQSGSDDGSWPFLGHAHGAKSRIPLSRACALLSSHLYLQSHTGYQAVQGGMGAAVRVGWGEEEEGLEDVLEGGGGVW